MPTEAAPVVVNGVAQIEAASSSGSAVSPGGAQEPRVYYDSYWPPFKIALQSSNPKIVETALDCIQKLVAFRCASRVHRRGLAHPPPSRFMRGALVDPQTHALLIDEIVESVANTFTVGKSDPSVQLQVRRGRFAAPVWPR